MKGDNLHHKVIVQSAISPVSISNGAATGIAIAEPWKKARQLGVILQGGAFSAGATATCAVQGLLRSDGTTWETIKNAAGTDITYTAAELADASALDGGAYLGTLPLADVDSSKYKSLRILFTATHATATMLVGASFVLFDLIREPSGQADKLFALAHVPAP